MKDLFFTRGQFAKYCKTTKETLRHYDKIGILKPEKTGENGYHYYSARQLLKFTLISSLKTTGCSLEEINKYISKPERVDFKELLTSQLEELLIEKRNIEKRERVLRSSIKRFDVLDGGCEINKFFIKEEEEEYFLVTEVEDSLSEFYWNKATNEHFDFCSKNNIDMEYQLSYVLHWGKNSDEEVWYVANKVPSKRDCEKLKVKPKGRYLKMIYLGKYNPDKFYEEAKNYAKENNLKLKGVSYESEVSIFMGYEFENYMVEISMKIE